MKTVLGIDLGTQSVKVVFYAFERRETIAVASAPLDIRQAEGGVAEQEAHWWIQALGDSLRQIDQNVRDSVVAVAVSGQQHGFVPVDDAGAVLAPVKLWCDTSTSAQCEAIIEQFGGAGLCLEEVGNNILPGYTASKIRWLRDAHLASYEKMTRIMLPHDYLNFFLTGEHCMEAGDASGTGLLDIRTRTWSDKMLHAVDPDRDLRACLPEVRIQNEAIGKLQVEAASELGLRAGIPVAIGGGDNMMGAIGTGNVAPGTVTVSLGTSGTVYAYSDQPVIDANGIIAAFCSSAGGWLPLLCTMNCTVATEQMRSLFGADIAGFERQLADARPGAGGVLTVPFFNGERTPNLPDAKACILGLDSANTRSENLLRSAVEGATFALRFGIDELKRLGVETKEIVLTGGGSNSATWRQVVADICNAPVVVLQNADGAAMGAALQALAMLEGHDDMHDLTKIHLQRDTQKCCQPDPSVVDIYAASYERYLRAVERTAALYS